MLKKELVSPVARFVSLSVSLAVFLAVGAWGVGCGGGKNKDDGAKEARDAGDASGMNAGDGGLPVSDTELIPGGAFEAPNGVRLSNGLASVAEPVEVEVEKVAEPSEPVPSAYERVAEPVRIRTSKNVVTNPEGPMLLGLPIPDGLETERLAVAVLRPSEQFSETPAGGFEWEVRQVMVDPDRRKVYLPIHTLYADGLVYAVVESPYHRAKPISEATKSGGGDTRKQKLEIETQVEVVCEGFDLQSSRSPSTDPCSQVVTDRIAALTKRLSEYAFDQGFKFPRIERETSLVFKGDGYEIDKVLNIQTVYAQKYHDEIVREEESVSSSRASELDAMKDGIPLAECKSTCSSNTFDDDDLESCTVDKANDKVTCAYKQKIGGCTSGGGLNGRMSYGGKMTVCVDTDGCDREFECDSGTDRCKPCDDGSTSCSYTRSCSADSDCAVGYRCDAGSCTSACSSDADCGPGYACDGSLGRCVGWCGLSQTKTGTVRHELMHGVQNAYFDGMPNWLKESTAEVSSHTRGEMRPDIARGFRKVGYPLELFTTKPDGNPAKGRFSLHGSAHYKAQDFWEFVGRSENVGLKLFEPIYKKMQAEKPGIWSASYAHVDDALDNAIGSSPSLGELYWEWVKNHVVEHKSQGWRRKLGATCDFKERRVLRQDVPEVDYSQGEQTTIDLPADRHWWRDCWNNPDDDSSNEKCWDRKKNSDGDLTEAEGWSCNSGYCKPETSCSSDSDCDSDNGFGCVSGSCTRTDADRTLQPMTSTALKLNLKASSRPYDALVFVQNPMQSTPDLKVKVYDDDDSGTTACHTQGDLTSGSEEFTVSPGQDKTVYVLVANTSIDTAYPIETQVVTRRSIRITKPSAGLGYKSSDEPTGIYSDEVTFSAETRGFKTPDNMTDITWGYRTGMNAPTRAIGKSKPGESLTFDELPCAETLYVDAIAFDGMNWRVEDTVELHCTYGSLVVRAQKNLTGNVRKDGVVEKLPTGPSSGELIVGDRMVGGSERVSEGYVSFDLSDLPSGVTDVMYSELFLWENDRTPKTTTPDLGSLRIWPVDYGSSLDAGDYGAMALGMQMPGFGYSSVDMSNLRQTRHLERVTDSARYFVDNMMPRAQFRLAFSRETDGDSSDDYVAFAASRLNTLLWPHLRIEYQMSKDPCCGRVENASQLPVVCSNKTAAQCACMNDSTGFCCNPGASGAASNPVWTRNCVRIYENQCSAGTYCHVNECNDGKDNDGDGWTDYPADPTCNNQADPSESNLANGFLLKPDCADGKDNDGDGKSDANDPDCRNGSDEES